MSITESPESLPSLSVVVCMFCHMIDALPSTRVLQKHTRQFSNDVSGILDDSPKMHFFLGFCFHTIFLPALFKSPI